MDLSGFKNRGRKGSHRNYSHAKILGLVTISGKLGEDAKNYQERIVKSTVEESKKRVTLIATQKSCIDRKKINVLLDVVQEWSLVVATAAIPRRCSLTYARSLLKP